MNRKLTLPLLALMAALVLLPPATLAQSVAPPAATEGPVLTDTKLGGLAAVGCGLFVRATLYTGGSQVGTIVGAVACCGYMLFDAAYMNPR